MSRLAKRRTAVVALVLTVVLATLVVAFVVHARADCTDRNPNHVRAGACTRGDG